jgi:acyl-CoA synthetase (AMP-forming)/AMP-acid ligase II
MAEPGIHRIEVTTLGDLLDLRAAEQGERPAMVFPDHEVSYAGLARRADFFARGLIAAGLKPGETVGILLPNCVDAIAALFGAAKAGQYPVPVNARYKSLELADLIRHSRIDFNERDLSSVRIVMTVGVPERLRDMASRMPHATQVSCFGMTEASSFLSLSYLTDTLEQRVCTGGHPMPGMECRVVDPVTGADLPPDTEGELLFRGSNCFSGYLNDPELTAQVFDDEGWFHTMDVATMDRDGRVTFVSRLKDMLKVGGENVSAAEVESYLLRHPAIGIVQVVSAPDDYYVEVPAAFIQLKPEATVTEQEIIDFCAGKIATLRVPRYVRFVTEWPMSGTKIKKAILREMIAADLKEKGITRAAKISTAS